MKFTNKKQKVSILIILVALLFAATALIVGNKDNADDNLGPAEDKKEQLQIEDEQKDELVRADEDRGTEEVAPRIESNNELQQQVVPPVDSNPELNVPSVNIINCTDCTFAPVDKNNQLPADYNPNGIIPQARAALSNLGGDAKVNGYDIEIISDFRSYATQQSTFNYWVEVEQGRGLSYQQAVDAANIYSAKPGHSEHQLGTTYDIKCAGCASFDLVQNAELNKYIEDNAHRFGFVISYPKNSQHLTGYTYEPWHIRWIGVDLATELYNTGYVNGNGNYLTHFLISKGY